MSEQSETEQSLDEINKSLYSEGMTDGLPVIPPTDERVEEMLRGIDRPRDDVVARLGNNENALTVETLAANAVMAGCLPTYMPVLEAGVRALADPDSNSIQFSVSTGSWAYQWIVNGPVREKLDIESSSGAFGPSFHANQTIARALGMAYRNTAKIYPGEKDMGVMGNPAKFYMLAAENEEASPWEPYHVTHGYDADDSTISLAGPNSWVQWLPSENEGEHVLRGMIRNTPESMRASSGEDLNATITHVINPYNAEELEKEDLTKEEIKEYIVENSYRTTDEYAPARHSGDGIPPRQVKQYQDTDAVKVACIGGPGRVNAIFGTSIGGPVTKKIHFPDNFDELLEEYADDVERNWVPTEGFYE
ncbi:hypothetical protein [Halobellus clavatus]|jgi:hypothetical protein|uniref:Uncharacterized protein n=1 Tax=Halobellus clavatus TaxID=660517 RepID=A0A1H3FTB7_9EURY|nr:hypothetical protein [Halobellus clavatus]SDX94323.1 hypothetical protein SAMN04487946_104170 [Halobellus clavatus]